MVSGEQANRVKPMSFVKALVPGIILTFVVCIILGSNGSQGGWLEIYRVHIEGISFYWSWQLFIAATGLSWGIFWMME